MYFDKNVIIKQVVSINQNLIDSNKVFNISYGVDKNFLFGAAISMTSITINNSNFRFHFHIFTDQIDDDCISKAKAFSEKFSIIITIYLIDTNCFSIFPSHKWPLATYFRFITFELLSEYLDTLLYLDADIICKGSIEELINLDLGEKFAATVLDINSMQQSSAERLDISEIDGSYFNAGFLYVNLKTWKKNSFTEKAVSLLCDPTNGKKLKYQDQDALNILFFKKTIMLPRKFNCIFSIKNELKDKSHEQYKTIIKDETIFIHYVGATKPWHAWSLYPSTKFFINAYKVSTWSNVKLLLPANASQWKEKSKHEFRKGEIIKSILSRWTYYKRKKASQSE